MKLSMSWYLVVGCFIAFSAFQAQADPGINVSVPDTSGAYNTSLQVPVRVGETTGQGILAIEFSVAYYSSIISIATNTAGSMVQSGWFVAENTIAGIGGMDTLKVSMATAQNILTGSGDLIYLTIADVRYSVSASINLAHFLFI